VRLGDSEREELFERLSRHAAAGRLDIEELEQRVAVLADLPPLPAEAAGSPGSRSRRGRGHGDADAPRSDWRPTSERFRDPRTGRVMRVWEDSGGGRHYVADDGEN
jgi:hypothetical protein